MLRVLAKTLGDILYYKLPISKKPDTPRTGRKQCLYY